MKTDAAAAARHPADTLPAVEAGTAAADGVPRAARHDLWHSVPDPERAPIPSALLPLGYRDRGRLHWRRDADCWRSSVDIGALEAGDLCVPSLVAGDVEPRAYAMWFTWPDGGRMALASICSDASLAGRWPAATMDEVRTAAGALRGGLDCVECAASVSGLGLEIEVVTAAADTPPHTPPHTPPDTLENAPQPPPDADLLIGIRPRRGSWHDAGAIAPELPVRALSQRECSDDIARHLCSPISVAMVLDRLGLAVDPEPFARTAEHPQHPMLFGMWPLNLARAYRAGAAGMVRIFTDASEAAALLRAGHALVASIRFEADELPGAPLARTGGHLVVLRGMGPEQVLVNDPAADTAAEAERHYDRAAFLAAWLGDRGVGYVLWRRPEAVGVGADRR